MQFSTCIIYLYVIYQQKGLLHIGIYNWRVLTSPLPLLIQSKLVLYRYSYCTHIFLFQAFKNFQFSDWGSYEAMTTSSPSGYVLDC